MELGIVRTKNTKGAFSSSIYGALINAVINMGTIKLIGLYAASVSTFISFLVMWIIREKPNRFELGIVISWREFWILLGIDMLLCLFTTIGNVWINVNLIIWGTMSFLIINRADLKNILNLLKKRKAK